MLSSVNSQNVMITLLLFSLPLLSYLDEVRAQSASVSDTGRGTGVITCPGGKQHAGPIRFEATSTASGVTGDWVISTRGPSGDVVKSGIIIAVNISPSGHFILTGRESGDAICGTLSGTPPISIEIIGECISGPSDGKLTTLRFSASNGEVGDFLSSPNCR